MTLLSPRSAALGLLLSALVPASAAAKDDARDASCPTAPTTQAFAAFGDTADYTLAPGGDFEEGAPGWTLTNATVAEGNETAGITEGSSSLLLGADPRGGTATATSPEFCVTDANPTFRFVVKTAGPVAGRRLTTVLDYRRLDQLDRVRTESVLAGLPSASDWAPSAVTPLATVLTSGKASRGKLVRISFTLPAALVAQGGVQIDSVLVDPFRRS